MVVATGWSKREKKGRTSMNDLAKIVSPACVALAAISARRRAPAQAQSADISFFLTSAGIGNGGDLGGLAGADDHCQTLAQAAGRARQDLARLSLDPGRRRRRRQCARPHRQRSLEERQGRRDRQGRRRSARRQQSDQADRAERKGRGHQRPGRYAEPARRADRIAAGGPAFAAGEDRTCNNWTSQHDRRGDGRPSRPQGLRDDDASKSWNASHPSRGPGGGCTQDDLKSTGGDGLLYCFATN